jgi:Protein-tyrosine phosphatase
MELVVTNRDAADHGETAGASSGASSGGDAYDGASPAGLVRLPSGVRVRGRRLVEGAGPADFTLVLAKGPRPAWEHRVVDWPDFWIPRDRADALDALREALDRAHAGQRVEAACRGGIGRTGTALAALAVLDGLPSSQAVAWVRAHYRPRAVETPWQRRWLRSLDRHRD